MTTLIVEDDLDIRETFKTALDLEGYEVYTASNGKEGLKQLQHMPRPCLIILDLMMPVMSGNEFLKVVEKDASLSNIPIVIVSAFTSLLNSKHARSVISKPVNLVQLLNVTQQYCGKQT